ncbi:MAG: Ig-like domain-containing protein, partial [Dysgonamonadaceae bacterium]|jgi:hypothetical protein|nr:Ig-like domain-containing protein [Dysgonamonadaceae bacterium]
VFETYPVNHKLLEAGDYIFAIEAHTEHTGNVHIGTETNAAGVYYRVDTDGNDTVVTAVSGSHLLVRVNTTSEIVVSPAVSSRRAGLSEPIAIFGPAVTGLNITENTPITIKAGDEKVENVAATFINIGHADHSGNHPHHEIIISHAPFEHDTEYTVTVPAGVITGYDEELVWSFTTAGPLEAVHFSPSKDATNVALDAPVHVVFDRDIPWIASHLDHGVTITTGSADFPVDSVTIRRHELIIAHQNFTEGTTYTVTISESVIDELESPVSWSFTTTTSSTTAISKITETGVSVYPTITEGNITVVSEQGSLIKIVDLTGSVKATYRAADRQTEINLGNNKPGLYLVVIETGETVETHKVFLILNRLNK